MRCAVVTRTVTGSTSRNSVVTDQDCERSLRHKVGVELIGLFDDIARRSVGWRTIARHFLEVFASGLHACDESILTRITSDYQVYTCG